MRTRLESPARQLAPRRSPAPVGPVTAGLLVSVAVHALLALGLLRLPVPASDRASATTALDVEVLPGVSHGGSATGRAVTAPRPPVPGGPVSPSNADGTRRGAGGDATGPQAVILLLDRTDAVTLQDSPMTATGAGQAQRIRTARDRASWEDRRATPNPADRPFLASGRGDLPERRPLTHRDPAPGARRAPEPGRRGAPTRERPDERSDAPGRAGDLHATGARTARLAAGTPGGARPLDPGGAADSPGKGTLRGRGERRGAAAPSAFARPPVDHAAAATTASEPGRVRDDTDAELLAARMVESFVESSRHRGRRAGPGEGGSAAAGPPGAGGVRGAGGRAHIHSPGPGAYAALDTGDARYQRWYLEQRRRVERALVFPHEREVAMDQGTTVYRVVVRRDGSLAHPPHLLRSSGFDDMDAAALSAIERAVPFRPLPEDLAPSHEAIRVTLAVQFANPMVR